MNNRFDQIPVSDKLDDVIELCMKQLRQEKKRKRNNRIKKTCISLGTAAAVFVCVIFFGASNPDAAESIPFLGHINRMMQGEDKQEYVQESNGVRITVSNITHNYNSISMNVQFYSKSGFPPEMFASSDSAECGLLEFISEIKLDFYHHTIADSSVMKGSFTDDYTFVGKINIPIDQRIPASEIESIQIPEKFLFDWKIRIIYDWPHDLWEFAEDYQNAYGYTLLPNKGFGGTWDFQFSIPLNLNGCFQKSS